MVSRDSSLSVYGTQGYALPLADLGVVGEMAARRRLARAFAHRQQRLPEILELAARKAAKRV